MFLLHCKNHFHEFPIFLLAFHPIFLQLRQQGWITTRKFFFEKKSKTKKKDQRSYFSLKRTRSQKKMGGHLVDLWNWFWSSALVWRNVFVSTESSFFFFVQGKMPHLILSDPPFDWTDFSFFFSSYEKVPTLKNHSWVFCRILRVWNLCAGHFLSPEICHLNVIIFSFV